MPHSRFAVCFALPLFLASTMAWADVPPLPDPCDSKKAGEACTMDNGVAGACATQTCSRLSYGPAPAEETPDGKGIDDGHSGPRTVEYSCVKCRPAPAAKPAPSDKKAPEPPPKTPSVTPGSTFACTLDPQSGNSPWGALAVLVFGAVWVRRRKATGC